MQKNIITIFICLVLAFLAQSSFASESQELVLKKIDNTMPDTLQPKPVIIPYLEPFEDQFSYLATPTNIIVTSQNILDEQDHYTENVKSEIELTLYLRSIRANLTALSKAKREINNEVTRLEKILSKGSEPQLLYKANQTKNDEYYQQLSRIQNNIYHSESLLVMIPQLHYELLRLKTKIEEKRIRLHNQYIFVENQPLYSFSAWSTAYSQFSEFLVQLKTSYNVYISFIKAQLTDYSKYILILLGLILFSGYILFYRKSVIQLCYKTKILFNLSLNDLAPIKALYELVCYAVLPISLIYILLYLLQTNSEAIASFPPSAASYYVITQALVNMIIFYIFIRVFKSTYLKYRCIIQKKPYKDIGLISKKCNQIILTISLILFVNNMDLFDITTEIIQIMPFDAAIIFDFIIGIILSYQLISFANLINKQNITQKNQAILLIAGTGIYILALFYPIATFLGQSNLSTGILLKALQTFIIVFIFILVIQSLRTLISRLFLKFEHILLPSNFKINKSSSYNDEVKNPHKTSKQKTLDNLKIINHWVTLIAQFSVLIATISILLIIFGIHPDRIYNWIDIIFNTGIDINDNISITLPYILKALITLFATIYITKLLQFILKKQILPYTNIDSGTQAAIHTAIGYFGMFLAIFLFTYALNISSTTILFILSGLSVGVGFGLRDHFSNFFSGFILIFERPLKVGDWIKVDGHTGVVKKIRIRATEIETLHHNNMIVPNSKLLNQYVTNHTQNPIDNMTFDIAVSHETDIVRFKKLLLCITQSHKQVLHNPQPTIEVKNITDSGVVLKLSAYVATLDFTSIKSDLQEDILKSCIRKKIKIAYPKLAVSKAI
jgi:small-conductance mechanosensitive channel